MTAEQQAALSRLLELRATHRAALHDLAAARARRNLARYRPTPPTMDDPLEGDDDGRAYGQPPAGWLPDADDERVHRCSQTARAAGADVLEAVRAAAAAGLDGATLAAELLRDSARHGELGAVWRSGTPPESVLSR